MSQDFFKYLPSDVTLNILSRLPVETIMKCKWVCKPWLDLLRTPEFVEFHISKSVPGLAVFQWGAQSKPLKIVEFVDEVDPNCHDQPCNIVFNLDLPFREPRHSFHFEFVDEVDPNCHEHDHLWNIVLNLDLPFREPLHSSANGLLFLCIQVNTGSQGSGGHILCNPLTRECINLPSPRQTYSRRAMFHRELYGFGASKISGQYKVVRLFLAEELPITPLFKCDRYECQVYTVGTGSWRRILSGERLTYDDCSGKYLHGNLHFSATNHFSSKWISCLNLETEVFSTFSVPPLPGTRKLRHLSILRDCLCLCDNPADRMASTREIDIWLMKEYGDEKSWTKDFVIQQSYNNAFSGFLSPIQVFKDGDILMEGIDWRSRLLYYSSKTKSIRQVNLCGLGTSILTITYSPSFLLLKTFEMENVSSF